MFNNRLDVELTEADRGDKQEHGEAFHSSAVILRTKSTVGDKINQVQRPVPVTWKVQAYIYNPYHWVKNRYESMVYAILANVISECIKRHIHDIY